MGVFCLINRPGVHLQVIGYVIFGFKVVITTNRIWRKMISIRGFPRFGAIHSLYRTSIYCKSHGNKTNKKKEKKNI